MVTQWQIIGGQDTIPWTAVTGKPATYTPPVATATTLGGVKIGANISVTADGTISVSENPDTFIIHRQEFITTAGQTRFTLANKYMMGRNAVSVFLFGQKLPNSAVKEISETVVDLVEAVDVGSLIEIEYMQLIDLYPYPIHAEQHLPNGLDPLPLATPTDPGWMSNTDKDKLDAISPEAKMVQNSTTNGNIKIDGVETQVYRHQTYVHDQAVANTLWIVEHYLGRYPSVTVVDVDGYVFVPDSIRYVSENRIEIGFTQNEAGKVFLN
jgi:hypothetical protein